MPKSNYGGKSSSRWLLKHLHRSAPLSRVLDVGPGQGIYVQMMRQPGQHWIGVEAWGPYIQKFDLKRQYDEVIVSDIRYFDWTRVAPLDLVICGDVLEHMTQSEAIAVVEKALAVARIVLISMPIIHSRQGELEGNPFEVHVEEDWTNERALAAFPHWCVNILESYLGVYLVCRTPDDRALLSSLANQMANNLDARRAELPHPITVRVNTAA
jgi:SAM-dependent methyltransferase